MASMFNRLKSNYQMFLQNGAAGQVRFDSKLTQSLHRVDNLEKRFLVWTGKYKSFAEVPDLVAQNVVERARNRMRIRIANYMMAATAIGCLIMAYLGKQDAKKGESVVKQNLAWHRQIKDDAEARENANK